MITVKEAAAQYRKILRALDAKFVFAADVAEILAMAFADGKNVLLWGPGGHGKSEMTEEALRSIGRWDRTFVQSFGEGMDEARLFGGIRVSKFLQDEFEYAVERSFLDKEYAVFEEIFDAPKIVLLALKDVLTRRELRNGAQRHPSSVKSIIACTNRDPREFADDDAAFLALLERFPYQLCVKWDDYSRANYELLYDRVLPKEDASGTERRKFIEVMAQIMSDLSEPHSIVSPRMALHASSGVKAYTAIHGRSQSWARDFSAIRRVSGFELHFEGLEEAIESVVNSFGTGFVKRELEQSLTAIEKQAEGVHDFDTLVGFEGQVRNLEHRAEQLQLEPGSTWKQRFAERCRTYLSEQE